MDMGELAIFIKRFLSARQTVVLALPSLQVGFDVSRRWIENSFERVKP
jgi:hypothetical protein